jgi:hypothetical protein
MVPEKIMTLLNPSSVVAELGIQIPVTEGPKSAAEAEAKSMTVNRARLGRLGRSQNTTANTADLTTLSLRRLSLPHPQHRLGTWERIFRAKKSRPFERLRCVVRQRATQVRLHARFDHDNAAHRSQRCGRESNSQLGGLRIGS